MGFLFKDFFKCAVKIKFDINIEENKGERI